MRGEEALRLAVTAALVHAEGLRMDTEEDDRIRLKLVETLRLALAIDKIEKRKYEKPDQLKDTP